MTVITDQAQVVPRETPSEHILQLFDTPESRGQGVATFLAADLANGPPGLVIAKAAHVQPIAESLAALGYSLPHLVASGRMTLLDAGSLADRVMRGGSPDPGRFEEAIGRPVRTLASEAGAATVRVYGEVVDLLAEERNFEGAGQLEQFWNRLGTHVPFRLLCGYASAHFAAPNGGSMLRTLCSHHGRVQQHEDDLLGTWLLGQGALAR